MATKKSAASRKAQLLLIAGSGRPRPNSKSGDRDERNLGNSLSSYTKRSHGCYDGEFTARIRELRPDWFVEKTESSSRNKAILIELARSGADRPKKTDDCEELSRLSVTLSNYTNLGNTTYDADFDAFIRSLRPDWFRSSSIS